MRAPFPFRPAAVAAAAGILLAALSAAPALADDDDVNDFDYASWDARYELGLDAEGRAVMQVQEHLIADFPAADQNRGIVRGLAERYQGADLNTTVVSVTDAEGAAVPFETEDEDGMLFVLTGTDEYVHGPTDYIITYEMRDVLLSASDTGTDEFYWDLLPLDSTQDIASFRAEIVLDPALAERLSGDASCYQGEEGSTDRCEFTGPTDEDGATVFSVRSGHRDAGDGVTLAIGFTAGTVTQPPARQANAMADAGPLVAAGVAVVVASGGWLAIGAHRRRSRRASGIIIAQYDVPADLPPLLAAGLIPGGRTPIAAQIVHLAVNGQLSIEDRGDKPPRLHRLDAAPADPLDARTLEELFRKGASTAKIPPSSTGFAQRMQRLEAEGAKEASMRGLTERKRSTLARVIASISIVPFLAAVSFTIWSFVEDRESAAPALLVTIVAFVVVIVSVLFAFSPHTVFTPAGAERHEHLAGVREFLRVAEADRMRMLQSFSGAERYTEDGVALVHLYERLLPYAILFGMEHEWGEVLETHYRDDDAAPAWLLDYQLGFFADHLTRFGATAQGAAHYSAPSAATSSGASGAMGGGFSGGGGGGGFSGGR